MSGRVANFMGDDWDVEQESDGFRWKRMRLGRRLGAEMLGAGVYELPPGERTFPYHLHHGNEEMLLVLDGEVTVRAPDGEHVLRTGDAIAFPRGAEGAHQIRNHGARPARLVVLSTMVEPDLTQFPDTGKLGLFAGTAPGGAPRKGDVYRFVRAEDVDYLEGEPT